MLKNKTTARALSKPLLTLWPV